MEYDWQGETTHLRTRRRIAHCPAVVCASVRLGVRRHPDGLLSPRGNWSFDPNHNPDQRYFLRVVKGTADGPRNMVLQEIASAGS